MRHEEREVYIIGSQQVQNELIAGYIHSQIGARCSIREHLHNVPSCKHSGDGHQRLILLDCQNKTKGDLQAQLRSECEDNLGGDYLILFNLEASIGVEQEALCCGVRGFFYCHDCLDSLLKGIRAVFHEEIWVSREKLMHFILGKAPEKCAPPQNSWCLTEREIEIIPLLAQGYSNQMIADRLYISIHTVKTHLYKLFRKIKVANRMQAVNWSKKHL